MNRKLFLIAGHSDSDPGAIAQHHVLGTVKESELSKELRDLVYSYYRSYNPEAPVFTDNDGHGLQQVINAVNAQITDNDIMLDIHFNAFNGKATGVESIVNGDSVKMGAEMSRELASIMKLRDRGAKDQTQTARGRIGILNGKGARVLVEVCFMDNPTDLDAYWKNKHLVAERIATIIEDYAKR